MKQFILIVLALVLMSAAVFAQTRRSRTVTAVTYTVLVNNCNEAEVVLSFSKKMSKAQLGSDGSQAQRDIPFIRNLAAANGVKVARVDGNDIVLDRSMGVALETTVANVAAVVEKEFGWRATQPLPTKTAHYPCMSGDDRATLLRLMLLDMLLRAPHPRPRSTPMPNPNLGPRRAPNGPIGFGR